MEIRVEEHSRHIVIVTIDNQPRRNAMSRQMLAEHVVDGESPAQSAVVSHERHFDTLPHTATPAGGLMPWQKCGSPSPQPALGQDNPTLSPLMQNDGESNQLNPRTVSVPERIWQRAPLFGPLRSLHIALPGQSLVVRHGIPSGVDPSMHPR